MLEKLRRIFSDSMIYGVAQLAGKILNFLLVPLFTFIMQKSEMGVYTDLYTWVAFLIIVLTFGSETAFFKFSQEIDDADPEKIEKQNVVLSTAMIGVAGVSIVFTALILLFLEPLAAVMRYQEAPEIIVMVLVILVLDVWSALPKAQLRKLGKAKQFAFVNLSAIIINITVNIILLLAIPKILAEGWLPASYFSWYDKTHIVHYVFTANICGSLGVFLLLLPIYFRINWHFDRTLFRRIIGFGLPLMLAGLAGMFNERADIQMIKYLLPEEIAMAEVGMYGTVYKFAMLLIIVNQAFRYAAEPLVFRHFKSIDMDHPDTKEAKEGLAQTTDWFIVVLSLVLVCTLSARVGIELLIAEKFEEGLYILPILLLSNVFYSIHTQLSFWYKLIGKTQYGLWITVCGAIVTLMMTLILIPTLGYEGAAWATLGSYTTMMLLSYFMGQKYNPYPYDVKQAGLLVGVAMVLGMISWQFGSWWLWPQVLCIASYLLFLKWILTPKWRKLKEA